MPILFAALVFLIILLILRGIYVYMAEPKEGDIIRGRLEAIEKGTTFTQNALNLDLIRDELLSSIRRSTRCWCVGRGRHACATSLPRPVCSETGKLVLISAVLGLIAFEATEIINGNFWLQPQRVSRLLSFR